MLALQAMRWRNNRYSRPAGIADTKKSQGSTSRLNSKLTMWCGGCQQDVPGIAPDGSNDAICCARCNQPLTKPQVDNANLRHETCNADCVLPENGAFDPQMLAIESALRVLAFLPNDRTGQPAEPCEVRHRTDPPHQRARKRAVTTAKPATPGRISPAKAALYAGIVLVLLGGGILAADQLVLGRELPWEVGLLAIVGGQAAAIIGFALGGNSDARELRASKDQLTTTRHDQPHKKHRQPPPALPDAAKAFADWRRRTALPIQKETERL